MSALPPKADMCSAQADVRFERTLEMTCDAVPGREPLRHIAVELKWKCKF